MTNEIGPQKDTAAREALIRQTIETQNEMACNVVKLFYRAASTMELDDAAKCMVEWETSSAQLFALFQPKLTDSDWRGLVQTWCKQLQETTFQLVAQYYKDKNDGTFEELYQRFNHDYNDNKKGVPELGVCPVCGGNDGFKNVGSQHWFYCKEHKTTWCTYSDLFSSWKDESEEDWEKNMEFFSDFTTVDPVIGLKLKCRELQERMHFFR